jgi:acyl-CoA synthetase (AMP-forming)/AMP-acid ligase II
MLDAVRQIIAALTQSGMPFEITQARIGEHAYPVYRHCPPNLGHLVEALSQHNDATALVYQDDRISYIQLQQQIHSTAHALIQELQVQPGERVAIAMRNYPEWLTAFLAITAIGAVAVPLNSWGSEQELQYGLDDSGSRVAFVDAQRLRKISSLPQCQDVTLICCRDKPQQSSSAIELSQWFEAYKDKGPIDRIDIEPDSVAMIMYTSGTTGRPKGVVTTHRALLTGLMNCELSSAIVAMQYPQFIAAAQQSKTQPAGLLTVPLFHVSGLHGTALPALRGGRKIVMMYKWEPREALQLMQQEGISALTGAPKMVESFLDAAEDSEVDLSRMAALTSAGQAQPERLTKRIRTAVPNGMLGVGYGMTEASSTICNLAGPLCLEYPNSVGLPLPTAKIEIRDEAGNALVAGQRGEIWVRGAMLMDGYWNQPQATEAVLQDGWYATGDIGVFDQSGILSIVDRKKDIVIRGGENIGCSEVEHVVDQMESVLECAAFGQPDAEWGEKLIMVVRCQDRHGLTAQDIQNFVGERLAAFKVPTHVYFQDDSLPRNATNKVIKPELKKRYSPPS